MNKLSKYIWLVMVTSWAVSIPWFIYLVIEKIMPGAILWVVIPVYSVLTYGGWKAFKVLDKDKNSK